MLVGASAWLLASCAGMSGLPSNPTERSQARWDALVAGDWATAYRYLSPGARTAMSEEDYAVQMRQRTINWIAADARDASCSEDEGVCEVKVAVNYSVNRGVPGLKKAVELQREVAERWVYADGAWYFVPDRLR